MRLLALRARLGFRAALWTVLDPHSGAYSLYAQYACMAAAGPSILTAIYACVYTV